MILEFDKYIEDRVRIPDPILIYPGLQLHVRQNNKLITIMGLPGRNMDTIAVSCSTLAKAKELFRDIDMFLQYRTDELPEYKL